MYRNHSRGRRRYRTRHYVREQPVWPLPALDGHPPALLSIDTVTRQALLAYRHSQIDGVSPAPSGLRASTSAVFMPERTPVLALKGGVVLGVSKHEGVYRVLLDHGNGFGTDYEGLHEANVGPRRVVKAGEVLGTIRSSAAAPCPLRFTLSRTDLIPGLPGFPRAVDPLDVLLGTVCIPLAVTSTAPTREEAA